MYSVDKFSVFIYLKASLFCFHSWMIFSLDIELWIDGISFSFNIIKNSFHKLTPISKTSLVFCIICFPEYNVLFSSGCFQNFFFIFDFQHFDYDVPRYYFLCIYSAWDCWAPWICYLYLTSNLRKFWTLFFQVVFLSHLISSHFLGLILC